jgi:SAM-dependent MidA family methyltransferase
VSALSDLIREEIRSRGPMRFDRFMELALYHPQLGYYRRRDHDPFGKHGDFYTASQVQPVFGRVIAREIRNLRGRMGSPEDFTVVELGPGRGEMAEALREFRYVPVEVGSDLPGSITGVVFSNEFFDALPVRVRAQIGDRWQERLVVAHNDGFAFTPEHGEIVEELHERTQEWMKRIAKSLHRGYVLTIDYGYTNREKIRFPLGTLMSYRAHHATEDVLADPGGRDITSHVPFDVLRDTEGLDVESFETLSQFVTRLGKPDHFAGLVDKGFEEQLKTLLFGMGETFRVLLQRKKP